MSKKNHQKKGVDQGRYDQPKQRYSMSLTPDTVTKLDEKALQYGVTRSELIERIARELLGNIGSIEARILGEPSANC
jgi:hypothetical protein